MAHSIPFWKVLCAALLATGLSASALLADIEIESAELENADAPPWRPESDDPTSLEDLLAIQNQLLEVLQGAKAAMVGIEGDGSGSGVIISKDGYVLTAGHVSGKPGTELRVVMPDGTRVKARALGATFADAGLVKIEEEGDWPTAPTASPSSVKIGDWCFVLGHPGGFDPERGAVLRIGRVLYNRTRTVKTDCKLLGGDSGGPLFDMSGRVIGINSRIRLGLDDNYHVTIRAIDRNWKKMVEGEVVGSRSRGPRLGGYLGALLEDHPDGAYIALVGKNTPAQEAGLKPGDIVTYADGAAIETKFDLSQIIAGKEAGEKLKLKVERPSRDLKLEIEVVLVFAPPPKRQ